MDTTPILNVKNLKKHFSVKGQTVKAVDGISLHIMPGETLSLVGESGCGKSTAGRAILRLIDLTEGEVELNGQRIDQMSARQLRPLRRHIQPVFQDPYSSLNPRMRLRDILAEPIRNFGLSPNAADIESRIRQLLEMVRLPADAAGRLPHEFSGGQRQRISIARALAAEPSLIVCDEAVSALDVSVKAQIVNLLQDLQKELGLALLFISHDLAIVEHMTHRVAVMYLGRIVEIASRERIFGSPQHPYTLALLSSVPVPEPGRTIDRIVLKGDVPSPMNPPKGCHFHTRCPFALDRCKTDEPKLRSVAPGQHVACHLHDLPPSENPIAQRTAVSEVSS